MRSKLETIGTRPMAATAPLVRWALVGAAAAALLVCTNGPSTFVGLNLMHPANLSFESWAFLYPFGTVALLGLVLLTRHLSEPSNRPSWLAIGPLAAYLTITVASATWSFAPNLTPVRAATGVGVAAFAVWFGSALTGREQCWAIAIGMQSGLMASALLLVVKPTWGQMDPFLNHPYWKGIWGNRNSLAPVAVLAILATVAVSALVRSPRAVLVGASFALFDLVMLVGAQSDTAFVALGGAVVAAALAAVLLPSLRRLGVPGPAVGAFAAAATYGLWRVFFARISWFTDLAGKDTSFTSRRPIWGAVRELIRVHPAKGYGYWAVWDSAVVNDVYSRLGAFGSAHNALLEVLLAVGFVGVVPFVGFVVVALHRPFGSVWCRPCVEALFWVAVVVFAVIENLTESFVLWHSYIWILVMGAAFTGPRSTSSARGPSGRVEP